MTFLCGARICVVAGQVESHGFFTVFLKSIIIDFEVSQSKAVNTEYMKLCDSGHMKEITYI